ncbi:hypothetical protein D3C71_1745730 [compost metagenome]
MLIQVVQRVWRLLVKLLGIVIGMPLIGLWRLTRWTLRLLAAVLRRLLKLALWLTRPLWHFPVKWLTPLYDRLLGSAPLTKLKAWIAAKKQR